MSFKYYYCCLLPFPKTLRIWGILHFAFYLSGLFSVFVAACVSWAPWARNIPYTSASVQSNHRRSSFLLHGSSCCWISCATFPLFTHGSILHSLIVRWNERTLRWKASRSSSMNVFFRSVLWRGRSALAGSAAVAGWSCADFLSSSGEEFHEDTGRICNCEAAVTSFPSAALQTRSELISKEQKQLSSTGNKQLPTFDLNKSYKLLSLLGKGAYGEVFHAKRKSDGMSVAPGTQWVSFRFFPQKRSWNDV